MGHWHHLPPDGVGSKPPVDAAGPSSQATTSVESKSTLHLTRSTSGVSLY